MKICFIVKPDKTKDNEWIEGIEFIKAYNPNEGLKYIKNIFQTLKLFRAMKKANADIYYFRGAKYESGFVALFCNIFKKKMIHAIASDMDCNLDTTIYIKSNIKKYIYAYGIKNAHIVLSQTNIQKNLLLKNFNLSAKVIKNIIPFPYLADKDILKKNKKVKKVLWVGSISPIKRPEIYIKIAKEFPNIHFTMIGGKASKYSAFYDYIQTQKNGLSNFTHIDYVSVEEIDYYFKHTDLLICTSLIEGFPNIFLQAWSNCKPVFSSFDPDQVIEKYNIGISVKTEEQFIKVLKKICNDDQSDLLYRMSQNAISYIKKEHTPEIVIQQLIEILQKITQ